jgi:hypothetical protein
MTNCSTEKTKQYIALFVENKLTTKMITLTLVEIILSIYNKCHADGEKLLRNESIAYQISQQILKSIIQEDSVDEFDNEIFHFVLMFQEKMINSGYLHNHSGSQFQDACDYTCTTNKKNFLPLIIAAKDLENI